MSEDFKLHPLLESLLSASKSYSSLAEAVEAGVSTGGWSSESVLCCAEDCLALFLQLNWTGPPVPSLQRQLEELLGEAGLQQLNTEALHMLSVDGDVSPERHSTCCEYSITSSHLVLIFYNISVQ